MQSWILALPQISSWYYRTGSKLKQFKALRETKKFRTQTPTRKKIKQSVLNENYLLNYNIAWTRMPSSMKSKTILGEKKKCWNEKIYCFIDNDNNKYLYIWCKNDILNVEIRRIHSIDQLYFLGTFRPQSSHILLCGQTDSRRKQIQRNAHAQNWFKRAKYERNEEKKFI